MNVSERALCHHLANYIERSVERVVPGRYSVDVEYNRKGADPKRLTLTRRNTTDSALRAITVFPDILVHERNTNDKNLLVIELKKPGEDIAYDTAKLRAFRNELQYAHTAHVILGINEGGERICDVSWVEDEQA